MVSQDSIFFVTNPCGIRTSIGRECAILFYVCAHMQIMRMLGMKNFHPGALLSQPVVIFDQNSPGWKKSEINRIDINHVNLNEMLVKFRK
jgi:hypothetical protein